MNHPVTFTRAARGDIAEALEWSEERFGEAVRQGYEALIVAALHAVANDPNLPGSRDRSDLAPGIRTLHLRTCRNEVSPNVRRITSPRHFVLYREVGEDTQVVRLLHEAMDISAQRIPE